MTTEVPAAFRAYGSDVKNVKHALDTHAVAKSRGWVAFRLADGTSPDNNTVYDSWSEAVRFQRWDRDNFAYVELQPDGCPSYREAEAILTYARTLHDMGYRIPSPDWEAGEMAASMPLRPSDRARMARQLASGKPLYPDGFAASNLPNERAK